MPRFFIEDHPEGEYLITGENGRHIARSLRMQPGEALTLCDGKGMDYHCTVLSCQGDQVLVQVENALPSSSEPKTQVIVCQCLAKGDKLETVTQKSVELGAVEIRPVISSRCVVKVDQKSAEKKQARLQKIAEEAAKQSGRGIIPSVFAPIPFRQAVEEAAARGDVFFFYEKAEDSFRSALQASGNVITIFIGPEGGFSPEEAELAKSFGGKLLSLGPRILRTETAPLAALAAIFYEKGDMERV